MYSQRTAYRVTRVYKKVNDNNCRVSTQTTYLPKLEKEAKKLAATQKGRSKEEEEGLSVIDLK